MRNMKSKILVIALAVIFVVFFSKDTLAYYSTIGKATNVITSGDIQFQIHEYTTDGELFPEDGVSVIPGDVVDKVVTIENICEQPFYLRVKLVIDIDSEELSADGCLSYDLNTQHWVSQEDGYIYYYRILQPGEVTEPVFTQVEIVGDMVDQHYLGETLTLSVTAHAVQSAHNSAAEPWEADGWPTE